jgi:hypothetical protein
MPSSNQFQAFATGGGANVLTPAAWAALTSLLANGFQTGTASSQQVNTAIRQATFVAAAISQAIADTLGAAVNDDGVIANYKTQFLSFLSTTGGLPSTTRQPFAQAVAPTGWTQDTTDAATNRMLRVVNTTGGGTGGNAAHSPILMNVVPSHTHAFTTGTESASHSHTDSGHTHQYTYDVHSPVRAGSTGDSPITPTATNTGTGYANLSIQTASHTHSGGTDNGSSQTNWQPRYIDMIICTKN